MSENYNVYLNELKILNFYISAFNLVHDCFVAAAERQIHVADAINFKIITKSGIEEKSMPLRRDWLLCYFFLHEKNIWNLLIMYEERIII